MGRAKQGDPIEELQVMAELIGIPTRPILCKDCGTLFTSDDVEVTESTHKGRVLVHCPKCSSPNHIKKELTVNLGMRHATQAAEAQQKAKKISTEKSTKRRRRSKRKL